MLSKTPSQGKQSRRHDEGDTVTKKRALEAYFHATSAIRELPAVLALRSANVTKGQCCHNALADLLVTLVEDAENKFQRELDFE